MYNIKFYKTYKDGDNTQESVACVSYQVYTRKCGRITITTHLSMINKDGVDRHVGNLDGDFDQCYVENSSGKTVDVFRISNPCEIK